jgi:uncharacterized damage-inducible protein DinB
MSLKDQITRLLRYNLWANERLIAFLTTVDRNIIYRPNSSSFGTIDHTLQHILSGQLYWHEVIVHQEINDFNLPLKENAVDEIMTDLIVSSQQLIDSISKFNEQQLLERIQASDSSQSRYEYIFHLVNHGTYHRGQVVTICRMLGVSSEIPVTDYDGYLWWLENT